MEPAIKQVIEYYVLQQLCGTFILCYISKLKLYQIIFQRY